MSADWKNGLPAGFVWNCISRLEREPKSDAIRNLRLVCKPWCAELTGSVTSGTYVAGKCSPMWLTLPKLNRLKILTVEEADGDLVLAEVKLAKSVLPLLSSVAFRGCSLDESPIPMSSALQGISELALVDCRLPASTHLWFLESLTSLTIRFIPREDDDDAAETDLKYGVVRIPALTTLYLSFVKVVEWEFGRLARLQSLDLNCCDIDDDGITEIGKIEGMKHLSALYCNYITDDGMSQLPRSLETLDIRNCDRIETTEWLPRLARLSSLSITVCEEEHVNAKLARIRRLDSLHVEVDSNQLSGEALAAMARQTNITSMNLRIRFVSCKSVEIRGHFVSSLVSLMCSWCTDTDEFMRELSGCSSLAKIRLQFCSHLTDAGLERLPGSLKRIVIDTCYGVTDDGVQKLRHRIPGLEVVTSCV